MYSKLFVFIIALIIPPMANADSDPVELGFKRFGINTQDKVKTLQGVASVAELNTGIGLALIGEEITNQVRRSNKPAKFAKRLAGRALPGVGIIIALDGTLRGMLTLKEYNPKVSPLGHLAAELVVPTHENKAAK